MFLADDEEPPRHQRCEKWATFRLSGAVGMESGVVLRLDSQRYIPELLEIQLSPIWPYAYTVYPQNILGKRADTLAALGVTLVERFDPPVPMGWASVRTDRPLAS